MTNKIYKDSVASRDRMYIFDSGAASPDSRGIALWVNRGKIEASVASQKRTWCLGEELSPFVERWNDLVLSWNRDKGRFHVNIIMKPKTEIFLKGQTNPVTVLKCICRAN